MSTDTPSSEYHPTSRRPIANIFRLTAGPAVSFCARAGIHPDTVSYASIVVSAAAGACFWQSGHHPWLLIPGPLLCYLRLWLNMLDGMVAIATNKASWRGEILNDLPDRLSDVLIFAGVAHSGLCSLDSGYWAAIMALLTAYVGMFGQAVGVKRQYGGVMSKPWRMVALHLGSWVTLYQIWFNNSQIRWHSRTTLDWTCLIIIVGCAQTIAIRLQRIFEGLRNKK